MEPWRTAPNLKRTVSAWRVAVYATATAAMTAVLLVNQGPRDAAAAVIVAVVLLLSLRRWDLSVQYLLLLDLAVSMAVWWLYGPISGAAMITVAVVAVAPLLLDWKSSWLVIGAALMTVPLETALHFLASEIPFPLFHPPGPVPTSEFIMGEVIKASLLIGVGVLMLDVSGMLRRGQRALAADLERERELSRLKDRFVATVSHELRTPLTSLKGFARTLLDDDVGSDDRAEFLGIMAEQADELHGRIEDLITFSRIGAGGVAIRQKAARLRDLVGESVAELGISVSRVVENQVPERLWVHVDPPRIKQVIRNLVDNAVEYGETPVDVVASEAGPSLRCQILDSGAGIPPEYAGRVFDRYSRLVDDPTMSRPGLGLGLPIVKELIEAHGGEVRVIRAGDMNGVEFTLPAVSNETVAASPHPRSFSWVDRPSDRIAGSVPHPDSG